MDQAFQPLLTAVRRNCAISDALHAGEYTLCVYLLKMREYFRWEKGYPFSMSLPNAEVGNWLREREQLWENLEHEPFGALPLAGAVHDPFETEQVNRIVNEHGLVYSAGLGQYGRPHFFLGLLEQRQNQERFTVLISAKEFARDLASPPAMTLGKTIFVRRESLRRMIWEKIEEWRWNRLDNAMGRAISGYDFDTSPDDALEQMTDDQIQSLLLHEIGEVMAGERLGNAWEEMLAELPRSRIEISLRGIRDQFADSLSTLPALLENGKDASLHFFFANLTAMRKQQAPQLLLTYDHWLKTRSLDALRDYIPAAQAHWQSLTVQVLQLHREGAPLEELQNLIDRHPL